MIKKVTLKEISQDPDKYKVCRNCEVVLNLFTNERCFICGMDEFDESEDAVNAWLEDNYSYWVIEEGYTKERADNILIEVS